MPEFAWWTTLAGRFQDRFPPGSTGDKAWRDLVENIENLRGQSPDAHLDEFDRFLTDPDVLLHKKWPPAPECRLFISHRQRDVAEARAIAVIARREGYGYWLDVEDPILQYVDKTPMGSPAKEILIAAAIEMGLLNSSHVIGVMTGNTAGSKWVPYELGRAKQRMLYSRFSAVWVDSPQTELDCGEYIRLAVINRTRTAVGDWLRNFKCMASKGNNNEICCTTPKTLTDLAQDIPEVPEALAKIDPGFLRQQAARVRQLARELVDDHVKRTLIALAEEYEKRAGRETTDETAGA